MVAHTQIDFTHESVIERFKTLMKKDRLAHAYLFIGPQEVGKSETAIAVAKLLIADGPDEVQEALSERVDSGTHPDVMFVQSEEGQAIKIAKVRELISRVPLRPYEAHRKVFVIKNVEDLTLEGSNALLKTLEEPSANNILILTTCVPERVLGTIKSRCQVVNFFPQAKDKLAARLKKDYHIKNDSNGFYVSFSQGCLGRAVRLNEANFIDQKNEILDSILYDRDNEAYLKSVLADKEKIKQVLEVLLMWFRDLLLIKSQADELQLVNLDRRKELLKMEKEYTFDQLKGIIQQAVQTTKLLKDNLNVKIPLTLLKEKIWAKS